MKKEKQIKKLRKALYFEYDCILQNVKDNKHIDYQEKQRLEEITIMLKELCEN